jgi:hypothetical protein
MPVTEPVAEPIFNNVLPVLHKPPDTPSVAVMFDPIHTCAGPPITVGVAFTVTSSNAEQPPPTV